MLERSGKPVRAVVGLVLAALGTVLVAGCAPALPSFAGGRTTPSGRLDLALGGATRVPLGALSPGESVDPATREAFVAFSQPGGVSPVASAHVGISDAIDVGLTVSSLLARLDLRAAHALSEGPTRWSLMAAVSPYVGSLHVAGDRSGQGNVSGHRLGAEFPLLVGLELGGVYELWGGLRLGLERFAGEIARSDTEGHYAGQGVGVRGGAVLGMAVGFRHVHALVELSAGYERWTGDIDTTHVRVSGLALTPAFGLRIRL